MVGEKPVKIPRAKGKRRTPLSGLRGSLTKLTSVQIGGKGKSKGDKGDKGNTGDNGKGKLKDGDKGKGD